MSSVGWMFCNLSKQAELFVILDNPSAFNFDYVSRRPDK
jgi:hypothetical protein